MADLFFPLTDERQKKGLNSHRRNQDEEYEDVLRASSPPSSVSSLAGQQRFTPLSADPSEARQHQQATTSSQYNQGLSPVTSETRGQRHTTYSPSEVQFHPQLTTGSSQSKETKSKKHSSVSSSDVEKSVASVIDVDIGDCVLVLIPDEELKMLRRARSWSQSRSMRRRSKTQGEEGKVRSIIDYCTVCIEYSLFNKYPRTNIISENCCKMPLIHK